MIRIKRGLDLPIKGAPEQKMTERKAVRRIALLGDDYVGMKPSFSVKETERVKAGQLLFTDKKIEGIRYTSPVSGRILEINRGERRAFQSIVIGVEGDEMIQFSSFRKRPPESLNETQVKELLLESGQWPALRKRPFGHTADPRQKPRALFITAMDTHPLAPNPLIAISKYAGEFKAGLHVLSKISPEKIYLCHAWGDDIPMVDLPMLESKAFTGPHPAGNVGTHIHFLCPVSLNKMVWHINYRDVIAFGYLFLRGKIFTEEIISLAGPKAKNPRLITTQTGANLSELCVDETTDSSEIRRISGSVLGGRTGWGPFDYLGRYHRQVSLIAEERERKFLGWQSLGFNKFSVKKVFLSSLFTGKKFFFSSSCNGSVRSIVPIGSYEKVMPLDILPTFLLRAIESRDLVRAQELGVLELDEEDLALCSFVDPCKNDFGPGLRECLASIEKEG
ncbi:MAG: Na(+)-translocating NADH-quinone reductase subunit A [Halobacteriovoraceae bacterium]|nr:Na(+)-translocating NADH-quinone reductase subunit A [Halobacteriovoraceae bacterium]